MLHDMSLDLGNGERRLAWRMQLPVKLRLAALPCRDERSGLRRPRGRLRQHRPRGEHGHAVAAGLRHRPADGRGRCACRHLRPAHDRHAGFRGAGDPAEDRRLRNEAR